MSETDMAFTDFAMALEDAAQSGCGRSELAERDQTGRT